MLAKGARILANLLLGGGVIATLIAGVLFWSALEGNSLPPPVEETTSGATLDSQTSYNPNEWRTCVACHWEIAGGKPPDTLGTSNDLSLGSPEGLPNRSGAADTPGASQPAISPSTARATPTALPQHKGALPERLTIPDRAVDGRVIPARAPALEGGGTDWEVPLENIAWYVGTALPGERGNTVMAGHVITRQGGGVFRNLHLVRPGDPVFVQTNEGIIAYTVDTIRRVLPSDISVLTDSAEPTLILITCAGDFDEATRTYSHRLVVTAKLAEAQQGTR